MLIHIVLILCFVLADVNYGFGIDHTQLKPTQHTHHDTAQFSVRIKDIAQITDVRDNQLVGYGLVVGLNGTGDSLNTIPYTRESLAGMLERLGVNTNDQTNLLGGKNVAAVMVSATLHPFARAGSRIDVTVSALGNAKDLRGGTLLVTPLLSGRDEVMAVAQGQVSVAGIVASGKAASTTIGIPTTAQIANGAIVEKEVEFELKNLSKLRLGLRNPDSTTSCRIAGAINHHFKQGIAKSLDPSTVDVEVPFSYRHNMAEFIMEMEQLSVCPDQAARVYIDSNGVIVMGGEVKITPVAVSHGSITIRVIERPEVSQPSMPAFYAPTTNVVSPPKETLESGKKLSTGLELQRLSDYYKGQKQEAKTRYDTLKRQVSLLSRKNRNQPEYLKSISEMYTQQIQQIDNEYAKEKKKIIAEEDSDDQLRTTSSLDKERGIGQSFQNDSNALYQKENGPKTVVVDRTDVSIKEQKEKFRIVGGTTLNDLVEALNALGVSSREMGEILRAIKTAGALQAEVVGA